MPKPNCYKCKWRGTLPGDAHSCCNHPATKNDIDNPMGVIMSIFGSVGRVKPVGGTNSILALGIEADEWGIRNGWFQFPWNFDPIWLKACNGFEK